MRKNALYESWVINTKDTMGRLCEDSGKGSALGIRENGEQKKKSGDEEYANEFREPPLEGTRLELKRKTTARKQRRMNVPRW